MKNNTTVDAMYEAAKKADAEFQAAVIRQFGKKHAGTMRYMGSRHNEETKAAANRYWVAANALLDAMREAKVAA